MRKLLLATSIVACLTASGGVALAGIEPPPPPQPPILVFSDGGSGCYLMGDPSQGLPGSGPRFSNNDSQGHVVASDVLLWQVSVAGDGDRSAKIHSAGSHRATCDGGGATYSVAKVKPTTSAAPTGPDFTVIWATSNADGAWRYEVQYRIGSGGWRSWFDRTGKRSARFDARDGTRYGFRVVTINPGEGATGWSPAKSVTA